MKLPSEAELIEMEQRFSWLSEYSEELEEKAEWARDHGNIGDAENYEWDAERLDAGKAYAD